jgi:signal transduction histidine kinase
LFGEGPAHPTGEPLHTSVAGDAMQAVSTAIETVYAARKAVTFTANLTDAAGATRHFELCAVPATVGEELVGVTIRSIDVTSVRRLEREVIDVVSRERQRLSNDLHEGLGQELTGVLLLLRSALTALDRGLPTARELVAQVIGYVSRSIQTTRELARGLSPVQIERGSLSGALERLAFDVGRGMQISVSANTLAEDIAVSDVVADHLYRIAQDAMANAARHEACANLRLALSANDSVLELSVSDDGIRPPLDGSSPDELGVKMMAYRTRLLGGSLRFTTGPDGGNLVTVTMPRALASA